jgi:hypothetical protein
MKEWTPDETFAVDTKECSFSTGYFWIVPAKVEGTWTLPQGELTLKQSFQTFSGMLHSGANALPVTNGKLSGDQINFNVGNDKYTGRVSGNTMQGTFESGGITTKWTATRVQKAFRVPSEKQDILGLLIQAKVTT